MGVQRGAPLWKKKVWRWKNKEKIPRQSTGELPMQYLVKLFSYKVLVLDFFIAVFQVYIIDSKSKPIISKVAQTGKWK